MSIERKESVGDETNKGLSPKKRSGADLKIQVREEEEESGGVSENGLKRLICIKCHEAFEVEPTVLESRIIEYCIPCYRSSMIRMSQDKLVWRPNHIDRHVYLGGYRTAENLSILEELNINRILVIGTGLSCHFPGKIEYFTIDLEDQDDQNIGQYFQPAIEFIHSSSGNILVHCHAGVSRSASLVVAYFMHLHRIPLQQAIKLVKSKRPCIAPNFGFMLQLREFEKQLFPDGENDAKDKSCC